MDLIRHPDRLLRPMMRDRSGVLVPATWDSALDQLAARIQWVRQRHGDDAVGVFGSGALTNEKAYLLGKFTRVALHSANIDYNGRFCMSSAAAAQNRAFGVDRGLPFPISDIADTRMLVLWGSNPADTMPPLMPWVESMRAAGGKLVVVDPRRTATAEAADLHLQPVPGTDLALALGLLRLIIVHRAVDDAYLRDRTQGWPEVAASVQEWVPDRVHSVTGVAPEQLERLLDGLARSPSAMMLSGRGPEQQSKGVDSVTALINVMLALGRVGRPASGYGCLTGQANGQGGREHGQKADQLPGYRSITDPVDRAAIAAAWRIEPSDLPGAGLSAVEMTAALGEPGGIQGLLVFGSDLAVACPDSAKVRDRLGRLDFLAVADSMPSTTAEQADFVLPVTQWAEEDGTLTNLEGRIIRRRRASTPPAGVRSDIEILCALADRLGRGERFRFSSSEAVFDELRVASAGGRADYAGVTYGRLEEQPGLFWPCPSESHPGTPRMFGERFAHADGRARMTAVTYRPPAEVPDDQYPVYFTTGRYREHYNSGTQSRRLDRLMRRQPVPKLEIHVLLAQQLGLEPGEPVMVESRRGAALFIAAPTDSIRTDTVFAPFHWAGEHSANQVTIDAVDPVSKMPEFKVCAVRVRRPVKDAIGG